MNACLTAVARSLPEHGSRPCAAACADAERARASGRFAPDFSRLKRAHTQGARTEAERERLGSEFRSEIEARAAALARAAPNLKALDQFEAVRVSFC